MKINIVVETDSVGEAQSVLSLLAQASGVQPVQAYQPQPAPGPGPALPQGGQPMPGFQPQGQPQPGLIQPGFAPSAGQGFAPQPATGFAPTTAPPATNIVSPSSGGQQAGAGDVVKAMQAWGKRTGRGAPGILEVLTHYQVPLGANGTPNVMQANPQQLAALLQHFNTQA